MDDTFIQNYRAMMPKLKNMSPIERTSAIADTIRQNAQIAKENREAVINNTFQTDKDGVNYGVGTDGNTYSYILLNNKITDFKPLSAEEQRSAINKITDGRIEIDPMVTNTQSLTDIFRSVSRIYNNGGNLVPDKTVVSDMNSSSYNIFGAQGRAFKHHDNTPDEIEISGLGFPKFRKAMEKEDYKSGFASTGKYPGEHVPTHELSHIAGYAAERVVDKWIEKKQKEAEENKNKYPADELFKKAINNFFGRQYEIDEEKSIGNQLLNEIYSKYDKWEDEDRNVRGRQIYDFLNVAAENAGFDSVEEAAMSISGYAGKTYPYYIYNGEQEESIGDFVDDREVFAEAYTDVLINGDDAKQFSKELIKLWSDYVDRWADRTGQTKAKRAQELKQMFQALPNFKTKSQKSPSELFNRNYKLLSRKK